MSGTGALSIATPALVIDDDTLQANIERLASFAGLQGLALRPHVKTHKSIEIARRQIAAGAVGITVATLSEAEVFAAAGMDDIFIAYSLWIDDSRRKALGHVLELASVLTGIDSAEGARQLAAAARDQRDRLRVLVEVDSGHHRGGVQPEDAGKLAGVAADAGLQVAGVFTFPGHSYSPATRRSAAQDEREALARAVASLERDGLTAAVVSGGSTPSAEFADSTVLTELRPGLYVFGDAQQWELGTIEPSQVALTVLATVMARYPDHLILDAGSKVLGADRGSYSSGFGRLIDYPEARIPALSEHHATVTGTDLPPGTRVRVVPNHACAAANLAGEYSVSDTGGQTRRLAVDARGRNT